MYQVYIVDDAVLTRKALVMTMPWDQWGCVVVGSADDGDHALCEIREMEPDIVITDIRMVRLSGLDLIGRCREEGIRSQDVYKRQVLKSFGYNFLVLLSGMSSVSDELIEAAKMCIRDRS